MGLSPKQRVFVEEYLKCWNAAEAARRAGYSVKTARKIGSENLTKPDISAAIDERLAELKLEADEVLVRLGAIARGTMRDFLTVNEAGQPDYDFSDAPLGLLKELKITTRKGEGWQEKSVEVKLYDAQGALTTLAKHHRLLTDRVEVRDWQTQAVADVLAGRISWEALRDELGSEIAGEIFNKAGLVVPGETGASADSDPAEPGESAD